MPLPMWIVLFGLAGLAYLGFGVYLWDLLERVWPFRYQQVPLRDLRGHVQELFRRGWNKTEMIIAAEEAPGVVKIRKAIRLNGVIGLAVIIDDPQRLRRECERRAIAALMEDNRLQCTFGITGLRSNPYVAVIDSGGDVDMALQAIGLVFDRFYCVGSTMTYRVWVRGIIDWRDKLVNGVEDGTRRDWALTLSGAYRPGKPYKRYYLPKRFSLSGVLGYITGRIIRAIRKILK